jgi:hypothetical protein
MQEGNVMNKRTLVVAALSGIVVFSTANSAVAQNTYSQDLLTGLVYDLLLPGNTYGPNSRPYPDGFGNDRYPDRSRGYSDPYSSPYGYEEPYRRDEGRYYDRERGDGDRLGRLEAKYEKAMRRLDRQEREALDKADRKYRGDRSHPGYRERLATIQRKYSHKRDKVEHNTAKEYQKGARRYGRQYADDDND